MTSIRLGELEGLPFRSMSQDVDWDKGRNSMKAEYDSLNLVLDVEEMAKIIETANRKLGLYAHVPEVKFIAQSLSDSIGKVLKICPAETERK